MRRKWFYYSIALLAVAAAVFSVYRRWLHDPPPVGEPPQAAPAVVEDQVKPEKIAQPRSSVPETDKPAASGDPDDFFNDTGNEDTGNDVLDVAQAELQKVRIDMFKTEAMETLPLLTLHTADPLQPGKPGPGPGEVWIRIKPGRSNETRDVMAQVADLYRSTVRHEKPVTVMLWVGGQPMARFEYDQ